MLSWGSERARWELPEASQQKSDTLRENLLLIVLDQMADGGKTDCFPTSQVEIMTLVRAMHVLTGYNDIS